MSYIDDWLGTSTEDRKHLQEVCQRPACSHQRYQHGEAQIVRGATRTISHTPGKCTRCRCQVFQPERAITEDEVLDVVEQLARIDRLADAGIGVLCAQIITRWIGDGQTIDVPCGLRPNHEGAHEAPGG